MVDSCYDYVNTLNRLNKSTSVLIQQTV